MATTHRPALARPPTRTWRAGACWLLCALVVACSTGAPPSTRSAPPSGVEPPARSALAGPFDARTIERAVEMLAAGGIPVRVNPDDASLAPVATPSRVRLLRWQARNLALEASTGAGTLGADLDAFAEAAGAPSVSPLIAGWLRSADTPAADQARALLPGRDSVPPEELVVPNVVMLLLVADLAGPDPAAAADTAVTGDTAAAGGVRLATYHGPVAQEADFCEGVAAYLGGALEGILDPALRPEPAWLAEAIELYADLETDPDRLRSAVGALALLAYATSISRPWVATLSAVPPEVHRQVAGNTLAGGSGQFTLNVTLGEPITDAAAGCADLAGAELGEEGAEGIEVGWLTTELAVHAELADIGGDLELEENGELASANLEYETREETGKAHGEGTLQTDVVTVGATVTRGEIGSLVDAVRGLLTGGETGLASDAVAARFAELELELEKRLYPSAAANVTITWHEEPDTPSAPPSDDPADGDFCTKYRDYVAWAAALPEDTDVTRELAAEVARRFDEMRPVAPDELADEVVLVWGIYEVFSGVDEPYNVPGAGHVGGGAIQDLPAALMAMHAYCDIPWPSP